MLDAKLDAKLDAIMDHVGWKSSSTARHYIKLNQVLCLGGAADTLSSMEIDLAKAYKQYVPAWFYYNIVDIRSSVVYLVFWSCLVHFAFVE